MWIIHWLINQRRVPFYVCLIPIAALITLILISILISFRQQAYPGDPVSYGFGAYPELYGDPLLRKTLINTLIFTLATIGTSVVFGSAAAWLVERTNLRVKYLPRTIMVIGLLIPGFLSAMGWVLLLDDRIGVINKTIQDIPGLSSFSINLAHPAAMGFVQGLGLTALVFIMVSSTFRAMNPALEDAASIHGLTHIPWNPGSRDIHSNYSCSRLRCSCHNRYV
jgi:iron(III) transport system permease protein